MSTPAPHSLFSGRAGSPKHIRLFCRIAAPLAVAAAAMVTTAPARAADCKSQPRAGIDWQGCNKSNIVMKGADLSGATLVDVDFTMTDLRSSALSGAKFEKATLVRSSLAGAEAAGSDFSRVEAYRTSFTGIAAADAIFASAELQRADFSSAELTNADFGKAELGRADFEGAVLGGASFAYANLSRADFTGAAFDAPVDLTGAFMFLTRIEGIDLSTATGLTQGQVDLACGDADTRVPEGLAAPQTWPCTFD